MPIYGITGPLDTPSGVGPVSVFRFDFKFRFWPETETLIRFLLGSRLKSLSIKSKLATGKSPTTDERDKQLLPLIKSGDKKAIDEFVDGMLALTICIAGQYARNNAREADELVSMGLIGLARALNELDQMRDENLKGFCIPRIHSACANYSPQESFGPSDYRTRAKFKDSYKQVELNDSLTPIPRHGYTIADVLEVLHVLDERELIVFQMVREGWELNDIASELGQSYKRIYRLWQVAKAKIKRAVEDA